MKRSAFVTLLVLSLVVCLPAMAKSPANAGGSVGASQVAIGFSGGSVWTSPSTGICVWYFPVVGDLDLKSLFATDASGAPVVDRAHSYLIWVSDFSVQPLPTSSATYFLGLAPAGEGTVYYSSRPDIRDWSDLTKRETWGLPVATFLREASLVRSGDGLASDTFIFSADLIWSKTVTLNGTQFNFGSLIPNGMTCFETGQQGSSWEAGTCIAIGAARRW